MSFPLRTRTRGRPSRNAGVVNAAAAPSFSNPLTGWTTDPVHGVWASDPLWTPPADGGAVSSWRNGGSVGGDLVQATGSKQPTYDAVNAAYNNAAVVTFDGTDDFLDVNVADVAQPFYAILIGNHADDTTLGEFMFGTGAAATHGFGTSSGEGVGLPNRLRTTAVLDGGARSAAVRCYVLTFNGASSGWSVNGTGVGSGDGGTGVFARFVLGAATDGTTVNFQGAVSIAYAAVFNTDPTALPEWAAFKAWCLSFYGITVA